MECTCIKIPAGTGKGKVKGYTMDGSCEHCITQRAVDAEAQIGQKKVEDANMLIAERSRKIAKDELIAEGLIENKDGKVKIKEV